MEIESTPAISAVSKQRAANGDPVLSSETLEAIRNGVPAPQVTNNDATTSLEQTQPITENTETATNSSSTISGRADAVVLDLSPEAQNLLDQNLTELTSLEETLQQDTDVNITNVNDNTDESSIVDGAIVQNNAIVNGVEEQTEQLDIIA